MRVQHTSISKPTFDHSCLTTLAASDTASVAKTALMAAASVLRKSVEVLLSQVLHVWHTALSSCHHAGVSVGSHCQPSLPVDLARLPARHGGGHRHRQRCDTFNSKALALIVGTDNGLAQLVY